MTYTLPNKATFSAENRWDAACESVERLTEREYEIFVMIGQGLDNKRISSALSISQRTVKFHVTSILRKLGIESRLQAGLAAAAHSRRPHLEPSVEQPGTGKGPEPAIFRSVMATFPTGVGIVTTLNGDERPRGMTCTSICSVTLAPPILLVSLRYGSQTLAAIMRRRTFAVNLLHCHAQATAELFATGQSDRFEHVRWRCGPGLGGPELPEDAHAAVHCLVISRQCVKDHVVVFGKVTSVSALAGAARPLLRGLRRYASWPEAGRLEAVSMECVSADFPKVQ